MNNIIFSASLAVALLTISSQSIMAVLTPPPCVKNTTTSGPWTDFFNVVRDIYHCGVGDVSVNVLHESPTSVTLQYLDSNGGHSAIIEESGILNWHMLSHQDDGVLTTDVLVPNP
jgi:hypothetical protein